MPHLLVVDIQISRIVEVSVIFCSGTINLFLWSALNRSCKDFTLNIVLLAAPCTIHFSLKSDL